MSDNRARVLGVALVILFIGMVIFLGEWAENRIWNGGICNICEEGHWKFVQAVGHRYSTDYLYKCNHCGYTVELDKYHQEIRG